MKPHEVASLGDALDDFAGPEPPPLDPVQALVLETYWRARRAAPPDEPVDVVAALALYERLYGPQADESYLIDAIQALDAEWARARAEDLDRRAADGESRQRRRSGRGG